MKKKILLGLLALLILTVIGLYAKSNMTELETTGFDSKIDGYRVYSHTFSIRPTTNDTTNGIDAGQFKYFTIQSWNTKATVACADSVNYTLNVQISQDNSHWSAYPEGGDSSLVSGADSTVGSSKKLTLYPARYIRILTVSNGAGVDSLYTGYVRLFMQQ